MSITSLSTIVAKNAVIAAHSQIDIQSPKKENKQSPKKDDAACLNASMVSGSPVNRLSEAMEVLGQDLSRLNLKDAKSTPKNTPEDSKQKQDYQVECVAVNRWFYKARQELETMPQSERIQLEEQESIEFVQQSLKERRQPAFIVNVILPFTDLENFEAFAVSMLEGFRSKDYKRIAIVLEVNAPASQKKAFLEEFADSKKIKEIEKMIAKFAFPVAVVRFIYRKINGGCAYGSARNAVLHSAETKMLIEYFALKSLHPYISFQDFDFCSRRVNDNDSGEHIFYRIQRILKRKIIPYVFGIGYRPVPLEEMTKKVQAALCAKDIFIDYYLIKEKIKKFSNFIENDMKHRDMYSKMHPLFSYMSEPALFVDGIAVLKASVLSKTLLNFSNGRSEFDGFAKKLHQYMAEELEHFYRKRLEEGLRKDLSEKRKSPINWFFGAVDLLNSEDEKYKNLLSSQLIAIFFAKLRCDKARKMHDAHHNKWEEDFENLRNAFINTMMKKNSSKYVSDKSFFESAMKVFLQKCAYSYEEVSAELMVNAQNNRHLIRGQSFFTDFQTTIETDTFRLAYDYFHNKKPQNHIDYRIIASRTFDGKGEKAGASLKSIVNYFNGLPDIKNVKEIKEEKNEIIKDKFLHFGFNVYDPKKSTFNQAIFDFIKENEIILGSQESQKLGSQLSFPFSEEGPFFGEYAGIFLNAQKTFFTHQVAIQKTLEEIDMGKLSKYIKEYQENHKNAIHTAEALASEQVLKTLENISAQIVKFVTQWNVFLIKLYLILLRKMK